MATDATGTPTAKGIPKYDTANDAPSGLGFNATMDAIDALLDKAQFISGSPSASAPIPVWNGSAWAYDKIDPSQIKQDGATTGQAIVWNGTEWAPGAAGTTVGYSTSLPGSPTDGQEHILVDSTSAPTYQWRFRYNSGSGSTHKWEFIGGIPKRVIVATDEGTASGTYVDLTTDGPSFTLPNAGDYLFGYGAELKGDTGFPVPIIGMHVNAVEVHRSSALVGGALGGNIWAQFRHDGASATHVAKLRYKSGSNTSNFINRTLLVTPYRVS